MQLLLIKINAVIDANPEYALLGKKQIEDRYTPGDWKKIRSLARGRRVLLIIPNNDVVLTSVKIPSKNKKQLLQAIPFALEDNLAEDIEALHFSIHQSDSEGDTQVAVINHQQLDTYIDLLKKHAITAHFVLPQILTQTTKPNAWSLLQTHDIKNIIEDGINIEDIENTENIENTKAIDKIDNDTSSSSVNVRLNTFYGFSCDKSLLDIFIQQIEDDIPEQLFSNLSADELPEALQELPLTSLEPQKVDYESAKSALALNLLTGFISNKRQSTINLKAWRPALVIASLLVATWIGIFAWQNTQLQNQRKQLDRSINTLFTKTFPKSRLVDPAQQMESKLKQLKKNAGTTVSSPLPIIANISPLLKAYKDLLLSEIRYKENKLEIIVESPSLIRLESFKKDAIKKSSLQVDISSSTTTADKVKAILLVSPLNLSKLDQERT